MSSKGNSSVFYALAAIGAAAAVGTLAWLFLDKASKAGKRDKKLDGDDSSENKTSKLVTNAPVDQAKTYSNDVIIEDASDDDDDDDDEDEDVIDGPDSIIEKQKQEEMKSLQDEYEKIINLAAKLLKGNAYQRAAEKYTEAIQLASKIPSQVKDLITLYNNRSATYEKSGDYKQSLSDIGVVLTMDPLHLKGRTRRARVLEAQGKIKEALDEYTLTLIIERDLKGEMPTNGDKVDSLAKKVAIIDAAPRVKAMRTNPSRSLPSKSYCRNFLWTFPSTHIWSSKYKGKQAIEATTPSDINESLQKVLYDLVNNRYSSAFAEVNALRATLTGTDVEGDNATISTVLELCGTEKYLKCNLDEAINDFQLALKSNEHNFEAHLKLASIYVELGELSNAEKCYEDILSKVETTDSLIKNIDCAWVLVHRSSLWVARNEEGVFLADAIEKAICDIDRSLELLEPYVDDYPEAKAGKVTCLLKSVNVLSQTKVIMGLVITEDDSKRNEQSIAEAKRICPNYDTVRLLECDSKASAGSFDEALEIIDEIMKVSDPGDSIPIVVKANTLIQRAIYDISNNPQDPSTVQRSQQVFKDVEGLYEQAIKVEPNGVEALIQYAHMMNMTGQTEVGEKLVNEAIPHARCRDELIELSQLLALTKSQIYAASIIKPQMEMMMNR